MPLSRDSGFQKRQSNKFLTLLDFQVPMCVGLTVGQILIPPFSTLLKFRLGERCRNGSHGLVEWREREVKHFFCALLHELLSP
jgi:hypothetical protein